MLPRAIPLLLALLPAVAGAQAKTALVASVAQRGSGHPIRDAEVVVVDLHRVARTDWLGRAVIADIAGGVHRVRVRKPGFVAADVELQFDGDSVGPVFFLDPIIPVLDTVRVGAKAIPPRLREFESRKQLGLGKFLTSEQLEKDGNREFSVVAVTHFPGLIIRNDAEGKQHLVSTRGPCGSSSGRSSNPPGLGAMSGRSVGARGGGGDQNQLVTSLGSCTGDTTCPVLVFLDGMRWSQEDVDLDFIRTWDLAGVEFYSGASVPVRYRQPGAACGVVLLWSR